MINSFIPKKQLNPKFWQDSKLDPEVRQHLLLVAQDYKTFLELEENQLVEDVKLVDITFTGSLANYNWSQYSDVDLHLLFDYSQVNDDYLDVVKNYFQAKKALWNANHNVHVFGYDVEVYPQDAQEEHISSGVYSVLKDDWINMPSKEDVDIDARLIKKKASQLIHIIDLIGDSEFTNEEKIALIEYVQAKIKKMRQAGLSREGEYSIENLVFKILRRTEYLDKLSDLKGQLIDQDISLQS